MKYPYIINTDLGYAQPFTAEENVSGEVPPGILITLPPRPETIGKKTCTIISPIVSSTYSIEYDKAEMAKELLATMPEKMTEIIRKDEIMLKQGIIPPDIDALIQKDYEIIIRNLRGKHLFDAPVITHEGEIKSNSTAVFMGADVHSAKIPPNAIKTNIYLPYEILLKGVAGVEDRLSCLHLVPKISPVIIAAVIIGGIILGVAGVYLATVLITAKEEEHKDDLVERIVEKTYEQKIDVDGDGTSDVHSFHQAYCFSQSVAMTKAGFDNLGRKSVVTHSEGAPLEEIVNDIYGREEERKWHEDIIDTIILLAIIGAGAYMAFKIVLPALRRRKYEK